MAPAEVDVNAFYAAITRAYDGHVDTLVQVFACEASCADCRERFPVVKAGEARCQDCAHEARAIPVEVPAFETEPTVVDQAADLRVRS